MIIHNSKDLFNISFGRKPILIMFPFGGGNTYSYRGLIEPLEASFDIVCPELPGRNILIDMPLSNSMPELVEFVYDRWIYPLKPDRPYILFGHSMGALMAYLIARVISEKGEAPLPFHIIATGMRAPSVPKQESYHGLPYEKFWNKIEQMGGVPKEVSGDEDIKRYFEPILRSDFTASETYAYTACVPLDVPVTVMSGADDKIDVPSLIPWQEETTKPVSFYRWEGGHFFIFDHISRIVAYLENLSVNL